MVLETSAEVRSSLIDALRLDLIGPEPNSTHAHETIPQAPSKWYLSGFLVPYEAKLSDRSDPDSNDSFDPQLSQSNQNGDDDNKPESPSARKGIFPSSMGLSFLISPDTKELKVDCTWGDYQPLPEEESEAETRLQATTSLPWQRIPHQSTLTLSLAPDSGSLPSTTIPPTQLETETIQLGVPTTDGMHQSISVPNSNGLELSLSVRSINHDCGLPNGTRSVSLFLVNKRSPAATSKKRDCAYIFQVQLTVRSQLPLVPRPDLRSQAIDDEDGQIADLQYRNDMEYAVGHNVSATALTLSQEDGLKCHQIQTQWMPQAEVEKVIPASIPGVNLDMEELGKDEKTADDIRAQVGGIVTAYTHWITQQRQTAPTQPPQRAQVSTELLNHAERVNQRIESGLAALDQPDVLEAFKIANRAIARAIRQRFTHGKADVLPEDMETSPAWRPFQLAFLLMNIPGIDNPEDDDRNTVDLLFFPTGGGKTEAYLGLAAFTLVLRRLRNPGLESAGLSVLMRYTLRLLTLDQLGRASTLICALELERLQNPEKLGTWPFEIGLWVGQAATANRMGKRGDSNTNSARSRTIAYLNDKSNESPIPLDNCPWCGTPFSKKSFTLLPTTDNPIDLRITCLNRKKRPDDQPQCVFRRDRSLPIVTVDEPIYRRLPCFLIATVDKFANLPWVGETASLFGKVERYDPEGFYGPSQPNRGGQLNKPLLPPDLIIQDELHLISGPLGTMVGLYETAIEALSSYEHNGKIIKPKIVASTATVRRAKSQIRALFGRDTVEVFPPPGPDRRDSFFAKTVSIQDKNARTYLGIAAQGRSLKVVLLRTYLALLGASKKAWEESGGRRNKQNPADPYMTLMGYFNSLRELGGSRRIVEDEVQARLEAYGDRTRINEDLGLFLNRKIKEPLELTSRVNTSQVSEAKSRLETTFHHAEDAQKAIDVVLATNMISVGLDITRLGLMVVLGQPKSASEYIQATSRVGRDDKRPGLVVTLLNIHRPRDRSHYERFRAWHDTFYRAVEATSVTPFSPRALDRGLPAVAVSLARLNHPHLTAPLGAGSVTSYRKDLEIVEEILSKRAEKHDRKLDAQQAEELRIKVQNITRDLLDSWAHIATDLEGDLQYQREVGKAPPLLFTPLDPDLPKQPKMAQKFKAQRSLRDVEPTVHLWLNDPNHEDGEKLS